MFVGTITVQHIRMVQYRALTSKWVKQLLSELWRHLGPDTLPLSRVQDLIRQLHYR